MTVFYLVRHGQTNFDLADERRLKGDSRSLVPLTREGQDEIVQASHTLRQLRAELILASPMTRALESAAILSCLLNLPIQVEFDLHEWIPDLTFSVTETTSVEVAYQEMMQAQEWQPDEPKNWEPLSCVRKRALGVLKRYCDLNYVLVVCHGVVIYSLTGQRINTGGYCPYEFDKDAVLPA
ncbi:MAG: histidine phosphatase family protein [Chloroflexi bacterium]|nr:histidine phosphatase family protein [Chloroflexota bacterium]